jgi:hypothetical protein
MSSIDYILFYSILLGCLMCIRGCCYYIGGGGGGGADLGCFYHRPSPSADEMSFPHTYIIYRYIIAEGHLQTIRKEEAKGMN